MIFCGPSVILNVFVRTGNEIVKLPHPSVYIHSILNKLIRVKEQTILQMHIPRKIQ